VGLAVRLGQRVEVPALPLDERVGVDAGQAEALEQLHEVFERRQLVGGVRGRGGGGFLGGGCHGFSFRFQGWGSGIQKSCQAGSGMRRAGALAARAVTNSSSAPASRYSAMTSTM